MKIGFNVLLWTTNLVEGEFHLLEKLKTDLVTILINLSIVEKPIENSEPIQETKIPFTSGKKMKRNEPCFCGSGKKYKHCCGLL